jgi:hypothetical protein
MHNHVDQRLEVCQDRTSDCDIVGKASVGHIFNQLSQSVARFDQDAKTSVNDAPHNEVDDNDE